MTGKDKASFAPVAIKAEPTGPTTFKVDLTLTEEQYKKALEDRQEFARQVSAYINRMSGLKLGSEAVVMVNPVFSKIEDIEGWVLT